MINYLLLTCWCDIMCIQFEYSEPAAILHSAVCYELTLLLYALSLNTFQGSMCNNKYYT